MCLHTFLEDVSDYFRLRKRRRDDNFLVGCRTAYSREAQLERNLLRISSTLMVAEHFCGTLDTSLPDDMESFNKNVRSHKMPEVPVCDARHPQRPLLAKVCYIKLWCMLLVN